MRPSLTIIRRPIRNSLCGLFLLVTAHASGASELDQPTHRSRLPHRTVADVLVVRSRSGMGPRLRQRMFAAQGVQEVGHIAALNASIVRVPHGRLATVQRRLRRSGYFMSVERDPVAAAAQFPNDPDLGQEWGLTKIDASSAWNVSMGSSDVTIAVLDSGIDSEIGRA